VVPCKAATDLAKGGAWPDTEEDGGSTPPAPTTPGLTGAFADLFVSAGHGSAVYEGSAVGEHITV
jgi:hypothetical protein